MSNKYYLLTYLVTYLASRFMNGAAGRKMDESFDPTIETVTHFYGEVLS